MREQGTERNTLMLPRSKKLVITRILQNYKILEFVFVKRDVVELVLVICVCRGSTYKTVRLQVLQGVTGLQGLHGCRGLHWGDRTLHNAVQLAKCLIDSFYIIE